MGGLVSSSHARLQLPVSHVGLVSRHRCRLESQRVPRLHHCLRVLQPAASLPLLHEGPSVCPPRSRVSGFYWLAPLAVSSHYDAAADSRFVFTAHACIRCPTNPRTQEKITQDARRTRATHATHTCAYTHTHAYSRKGRARTFAHTQHLYAGVCRSLSPCDARSYSH